MKSGFPALKTSRALAWTQIHEPVLARSLKTLKPLSPVFITAQRHGESKQQNAFRTTRRETLKRGACTRLQGRLTPDVVVGAVHHVCRVDEVVARALHAELHFVVTQNHLPSVEPQGLRR